MRRRDYFRINVQTENGMVPVVTTEHVGTHETLPPKGIELRKTGQCKRCGKMIGRGLNFHTKACRGTMDLK